MQLSIIRHQHVSSSCRLVSEACLCIQAPKLIGWHCTQKNPGFRHTKYIGKDENVAEASSFTRQRCNTAPDRAILCTLVMQLRFDV